MIRAGTLSPVEELGELRDADISEVEAAFRDFVEQVVRARLAPATRDRKAERAAIDRLREVLATAAAFADVLGRTRTLRGLSARERAKAAVALAFAEPETPRADRLRKLLGLGFDEAVEQMVGAVPELARSQDEIRDVYERGGFALVKSADLAVTEAVQEKVAEAVATGGEVKTVEAAMAALDESFVGAYARLVFRNASMRAYNAGQVRQARKIPGVAGLEYLATHDPNVRPNHLAADGMVAAVEDPVWDRLSPPLGHQCRCGLRPVMFVEAERRGLELDADGKVPRPIQPGRWEAARPGELPPRAHPDEGGSWGRRPDAIYRSGGLAG